MTKQIRNQIINLSQSIFNDVEFNKVIYYLDKGKINALRLFVDEKLMILESIFEMDNTNQVLLSQIKLCNELDDVIIDAYLEIMK